MLFLNPINPAALHFYNQLLKGIICFVIVLHIVIIGFISQFSEIIPKPAVKKALLTVKTIKLTQSPPPIKQSIPKQQSVPQETIPVEIAPPPEVKKQVQTKPLAKKEVKTSVKKEKVQEKQIKKKEESPAPSQAISKEVTAKAKQKELIAYAQEKISKIVIKSDKVFASSFENVKDIPAPAVIKNFSNELSFVDKGAVFDEKEMRYRDELACRLKLNLILPEYGEVKLTLTLDRLGKVIGVKIHSHKSAKNAAYIEKQLPKLQLPGFGSHFGNVSTYDFTIVMSNE